MESAAKRCPQSQLKALRLKCVSGFESSKVSPHNILILLHFYICRLRRNSSDTSAGCRLCIASVPLQRRKTAAHGARTPFVSLGLSRSADVECFCGSRAASGGRRETEKSAVPQIKRRPPCRFLMWYRRTPSLALAEVNKKSSFFLTVPAKKTRTLCCRQFVASIISAMLAPSDRLRRVSMRSCFVVRSAFGSSACGGVFGDVLALAAANVIWGRDAAFDLALPFWRRCSLDFGISAMGSVDTVLGSVAFAASGLTLAPPTAPQFARRAFTCRRAVRFAGSQT